MSNKVIKAAPGHARHGGEESKDATGRGRRAAAPTPEELLEEAHAASEILAGYTELWSPANLMHHMEIVDIARTTADEVLASLPRAQRKDVADGKAAVAQAYEVLKAYHDAAPAIEPIVRNI
ncbi:hypothetical protein [Nocardioides yefusunii]|uniref:Uncharacterized protein n=1 Tax=Nocardioides yefusunii TaxID=2500546 RepID=A0ABW1QVP7_9ACTN|nr:hypothetical protein [Nocardioides yefusunii]